MDDSVQIKDYIAMQIVDSFCGIFTTGSFDLCYMSKFIFLELF